MPDRKAVVFGSGGQLGLELRKEFAARGWLVRGFARGDVDIASLGKVEAALAEFDPHIVLNAAAYNQVDVAESDPLAAFQANALAVRNLALCCRQIDALLVHFSTDYVFDGTKGAPYTEDDPTHPLGAYGVSKLTGELFTQAYLDRYLVVRTSGVYGPGGRATNRGNFVELMLRLAGAGQPIRVVEDHVASPTYAPALAARTADLVEGGHTGVFHAGGGEAISWFAWAQMIFAAAGLQPELRATSEREYRTPARRPRYSALSNRKMESLGIAPMPKLDEAIRLYLAVR